MSNWTSNRNGNTNKTAQARSQKINWKQQKNIINDLKWQQAYQPHASKYKSSIN